MTQLRNQQKQSLFGNSSTELRKEGLLPLEVRGGTWSKGDLIIPNKSHKRWTSAGRGPPSGREAQRPHGFRPGPLGAGHSDYDTIRTQASN